MGPRGRVRGRGCYVTEKWAVLYLSSFILKMTKIQAIHSAGNEHVQTPKKSKCVFQMMMQDVRQLLE